MKLFNFSAENCKNCYKCVRYCSVKAIKIKNNKAEIDEEKCIACGQCFVVCPKNARNIENEIDLVMKKLEEPNTRVTACIDSSYLGVFEDPGKFITGLKKIGFETVQEVAVGAAAITKEYIEFINKNQEAKYIISSSCPSIYLDIIKYHPEIAKYLMPIVTPTLALGKAIKQETPDMYTVYIGPCLSKKYETNNSDINYPINSLITFEEILFILRKKLVKLDELKGTEPDRTASFYGDKYSIAGDSWPILRKALDENSFDFFHVSGLDNVKTLFELIENDRLEKSYIGISACRESCIMGPFIPKSSPNVFSRKQKMKFFVSHGWSKENELPEINWENIDLSKNHIPKPVNRAKATKSEIEDILRKMDKHSRKDELDCGACGYDSCREKAQAVFEGMAEVEMCMPYMRSKAENMSDVIFLNSRNIVMLIDENLRVKQFNPAAEKCFQVKSEFIFDKPVSILMDDKYFAKAFELKSDIMNIKIELPNYGLIVMQNIVYIKKENVLFVSQQNVTEDEKRKEELDKLKINTVDIAQNVIEKQMRVAQEIASLLGETTAETKVALNKLKEVVLKEGN